MKEFTVPYQDWDHINVLVVLQSCADLLQALPGSSNETFPTLFDGTFHMGNMKSEEDMDME